MQPPVDTGQQTYWNNGLPAEGLKNKTANPGSERFWFEGTSEENLFLLTNQDTGKFFLLFE